ncbi:hypothetical protein, partial [Saccharophagus degradans]|nr:hypothetical protein [Saccharophagus degradans]
GGTGLYQALTATYAGTVTFSTTPTPIKFEVIDLDLGTSESVTAVRVYNFNVIDKVVTVDTLDPEAVLDA